jgi:hypothetical protein
MNEREERIGRNEIVFREVNERLEELNEAFGPLTQTAAFVCECGNMDCVEQITMPLGEYESVRSEPTLFAVVKGHETAELEEIVESHEHYHVVRKIRGEPAELAVAEDPRGGNSHRSP